MNLRNLSTICHSERSEESYIIDSSSLHNSRVLPRVEDSSLRSEGQKSIFILYKPYPKTNTVPGRFLAAI